MHTPEFTGPFGQAWRFDLDAIERKHGVHCALASWLVRCPTAHPFWHSYEVSVQHLRPTPAFPKPIVYLFGATHEIFVFALDPRVEADLTDAPARLFPCNFVGQWIADGDESAVARVQQTVEDIVNGRLNPDTDALRQWCAEYGDHCIKPEYRPGKGGK